MVVLASTYGHGVPRLLGDVNHEVPLRLPDPKPPEPELYVFDVLITQAVGLPATGNTVRLQPTGGSEWQTVLLAESLAERGYSVGVCSPVQMFHKVNGVTYIPLAEIHGRIDAYGTARPSARLQCEVLVSERFGPIPPVEFQRIVFDLHDIPDPRLEHVMQTLGQIPESQVVVHSHFVKDLLTDWPRVSVIPCMLPDSFYDRVEHVKMNERVHRYVYGSAAMKGLEPTIALWNDIKRSSNYHFRKATLTITSPGYDSFDMKILEGAKDVIVHHGLSPAGMQRLLQGSDGIFMASTFPETFGIIFAQCEAAGRPARVLQLHQGDALDATLATPDVVFKDAAEYVKSFEHDYGDIVPNNFRVSAHIDLWISVLGLKQQAKVAA